MFQYNTQKTPESLPQIATSWQIPLGIWPFILDLVLFLYGPESKYVFQKKSPRAFM